MILHIKKLFFTITFNFSLFLLLMIGIQNSSNKKKVNLIISETINLPISFIVGMSFISGSIAGSLLTVNFRNTKGSKSYKDIS